MLKRLLHVPAATTAALVAIVTLGGCDANPAGVDAEFATAPAGSDGRIATRGTTTRNTTTRDTTTRDPERRPERGPTDRIQAAARSAIDHAQELLGRANGLLGEDVRPAVQQALAEARQLIAQAVEAYGNGDFSRALVKAQNAIEILLQVLRVLG